VIVASLFPQASNTTTGTLQADVARVSGLRRDAPALQFVVGLAQTYDCIAIAVPGFAAGCLETVDEIGFELREEFVAFPMTGVLPRLGER
jgi:protoheme ferro-lyase